MSALCPWCLKPLAAEFELPVCPHCAQRLPPPQSPSPDEPAGPPATGFETRAELTGRFFTQPDTYTLAPGYYLLHLLVPALLPVGAWFMAGPAWLTATMATFAVVLSLQSAWHRWPRRHRVVLDQRGIRYRQRAIPWSRVTGSELATARGRRLEPERLDIIVRGEPPVPIARDLIRTGEIQSLRNLAAVIDLIAAAPEEDAR